jgi:2',3'-cyclic-nucleotide 2'-phosphodiesterase (5'-nucleotidase family)
VRQTFLGMSATAALLALAGLLLAALVSLPSRSAPARALVVFATGANRGELEPCGCSPAQKGGLARRAALVDSLRRTAGPAILLDCGDHTHADRERDERLNGFIRWAMDSMGYDAMTLGELELGRGAAYVKAMLDSVRTPITLANVRFRASGEPVGERSLVIRRGETTCAVLGLIGPDLLPTGFDTLAGGFEVADPVATARELVPELRPQADFVIVLAHLAPGAARALADQVPGVDLVVLGHEQGPLPAAGSTTGAATAASGERGQWLSRTQLERIAESSPEVRVTGAVIPLTLRDHRASPDIAAALDELHRTMNAERRAASIAEAERLAELRPLPGQDRHLGDRRCARCHQSIHDDWQRTAHAHAFDTLVKSHREHDPECLPCHVTGFETAGGFLGGAPYQDMREVQCESCHGMGTLHDMMGALDPDPGLAACRRCHTPEMSPEFDFARYWPPIAH